MRSSGREVSADEDAIEAIEAEAAASAAPMAETFEINADLGRLTNAWNGLTRQSATASCSPC